MMRTTIGAFFIVLSLCCIALANHSEKFAETIWHSKTETQRLWAKTLLKNPRVPVSGKVTEYRLERDGTVSLELHFPNETVTIQSYKPAKSLEKQYLEKIRPTGQIVAYCRPHDPTAVVLLPTWRLAQRLLAEPKPDRVSADTTSERIALWGYIGACLLFSFGILTFVNSNSRRSPGEPVTR